VCDGYRGNVEIQSLPQILNFWPGVVIHDCNSSTQESEAGGLRVQGQPRLHSQTLKKLRAGCSSVVELLPSFFKALGSILSTAK
jgi:hypothetical protein